MRHLFFVASVGLGVWACSSDDTSEPNTNQPTQNNVANNTANNTAEPPEFEIDVVEGLSTTSIVGDNAAVALTGDGAYAIAYGFLPVGGAGTDREIHYAEHSGDGVWTIETVARPGAQTPNGGPFLGLGFTFIAGTPYIVFNGGDDDGNMLTPFPTDLVLATKNGGQWSERTLVDTSAEAAGDCSLYCNEGHVVGTHAAIAARPGGGFAVVYRDTHFGFARDDFARADVEIYEEGGSVGHLVIDPERSGGEFGNITYATNGNPVVAYNIETQASGEDHIGVWVGTYDGTEWVLTRVSSSQIRQKAALETAPDGTLYLAFHAEDSNDLVVATSNDNGLTWQNETVDESGKTGLHPSLAFDDQGRPVISYTYCGPTSDRDCPGTLGPQSEVRVARREASGWMTYTVDDGQGFGGVGFFTSIVVDANGKMGIAFQDARNSDLIFAREQ